MYHGGQSATEILLQSQAYNVCVSHHLFYDPAAYYDGCLVTTYDIEYN